MIEIIPAIDLIDGKCVRLTEGDYERKSVYADDPLDVALRFQDAGIKRLHMVDLDGAKRGKPANLAVLERIAKSTTLTIDYGGGIKSDDDLDSVFGAGAAIANIGSVAAKEPEKFLAWIGRYGSERILLGADAKNGNVAINGWQNVTEISVVDMLGDFFDKGVSTAFVTDIGSDGAMNGPAVGLYSEIRKALPQLELIASGGVSSIEDIAELEQIGCTGVIVGKAIYEGKIKLDELSKYAG